MANKGTIDQLAPSAAFKPEHYPESDGQFLPEIPLQFRAVVSARIDLTRRFNGVLDIVLEGNASALRARKASAEQLS